MQNRRRLILIGIGGVGVVVLLLIIGQLMGGSDEPVPKKVQPKQEEVLVAAFDIKPGMKVKVTSFKWIKRERHNVPSGAILRSVQPGAPRKLAGSVSRSNIVMNEAILLSSFMRYGDGSEGGFMSAILNPGMRAVAIPVRPLSTAGGFILPNDRVDVILSNRSQGQFGLQTGAIMTDIRVLAIDQVLNQPEGEIAILARDTVTLEVSPEQVERLARAQQVGTLSLALRPIAEKQGVQYGVRDDHTVMFIKQGITSEVLLMPER